MKQEFIEFLNALIAAAPEVEMSDNVKLYIQTLNDENDEKPVLTDNGKLVLDYMQKSTMPMFKARDIADGLFISSRTVSGALRKLTNDKFVEKMNAGGSPVIYTLTEKGKEFIIE